MSGTLILIITMNLMLMVLLTSVYAETPNLKKLGIYLGTFILVLAIYLNLYIEVQIIKPIIMLLALLIANCLYKPRDLKDILISSFIMEILIISSELVISVFYIIFYSIPSTQTFVNEYNQTFINVGVLSYIYIISLTRFPNKFYKYMQEKTEFIPRKSIFLAFILLISVSVFIIYSILFNVHFVVFIVLAIVLFILFTLFVIVILKSKNDLLEVQRKYENALFNLKEYETAIDTYKIRAHEEKNQFVVVRNLVLMEENKLAKEYINNILEIEYTKDEETTLRLNNIPCTPLKAIMYNKFSAMRKLDIEHSFLISREIRMNQYDEFPETVAYDLTRMFSVFIDNAIDEIKQHKKGVICIDVFLEEEYFVIEISNTLTTKIDFDVLATPGYTTKEDGHGYGLSLVNQILEKSKYIKNERCIFGDMFKQKIKIKMKKNLK